MKKKDKKFRKWLLKIIWSTLPILFIFMLIALAWQLGAKVQVQKKRLESEKANSLPPEQPPVKVVVQEIQAKTIEDRLTLPGIVQPWEDLTVRAEVSGLIIEVPVREGDTVKKGQVLARVDRRDYQNRLAQAEAAYNLARLDYDRLSKLLESNAISAAQVDSSLSHLKQAKANLDSTQLDLQRTIIESPLTGYINRLDAKIGLLINRSDPIAQILDTRQVKVEVGIPESDIKAIQYLEKAWITLEALDSEKFLGLNIFLAKQPEPSSRVYNLKLAVNNQEGKIRPGMFSSVEMVKRRYQDAVSIPLYAVIARGDERFVYVLNDSAAHYRRVELGILDGWQVQITSGLNIGDRVIIVGHRGLEDGQKVEVERIVHDPGELVG